MQKSRDQVKQERFIIEQRSFETPILKEYIALDTLT